MMRALRVVDGGSVPDRNLCTCRLWGRTDVSPLERVASIIFSCMLATMNLN